MRGSAIDIDESEMHAAPIRAARFLGVTVVTASLGQLLIFVFFGVLGWEPIVANGVAALIVAVVGFQLSLRFVWTGPTTTARNTQVMAFVLMNVVGLAISTLTVRGITSSWDDELAANAGSLVGYGIVWALRFVVLDRLVFASVRI